METVCEYTDKTTLWISTDDRSLKTKLLKLKEQYPDDMHIIAGPDDNDGVLYLKCPVEWLKISPKRRVNMSDERRAILAERLKSMRKSKAES